ncbi:type VII secretion system-associated protein [Streptomyces sp. NPDC019224]|uniref:type VII secretion system-associated protein n=1 Tax=Streptomyces sp. NPDC019224 TaxID=3154484 RepID=UPI0033E5B00D
MATSPTDLSHLDTETLRRFTDTDVAEFVKLLTDLVTDTPGHEVSGMAALAAQFSSPQTGYVRTALKVGKLGASGDESAGPLSMAPLLSYLASAATSLAGIEEDQLKLFNDIKRELGAVVTDMEKTQKDSLDEIESRKFLNDLHHVNADLAPTDPA